MRYIWNNKTYIRGAYLWEHVWCKRSMFEIVFEIVFVVKGVASFVAVRCSPQYQCRPQSWATSRHIIIKITGINEVLCCKRLSYSYVISYYLIHTRLVTNLFIRD